MADSDAAQPSAFAKFGAWLKENKAYAIPVAAAMLGFGAASIDRRRDVRRSYEDGFESGWEANGRRRDAPELPEGDEED